MRAPHGTLIALVALLSMSCANKEAGAPLPYPGADEPPTIESVTQGQPGGGGGATGNNNEPSKPADPAPPPEPEPNEHWAQPPDTKPMASPTAASTPPPPPRKPTKDFDAAKMEPEKTVDAPMGPGARGASEVIGNPAPVVVRGELALDPGATAFGDGTLAKQPPDALEAALGGGWRGAGDDDTRNAEGERLGRDGKEEVAKEAIDAEVAEDESEEEINGDELKKKERKREAPKMGEVTALPRGSHTVRFLSEDPNAFVPPSKTLPRMFYFENTYLGGSAAYAERLRRLDQALQGQERPYDIVAAEVQPFDAPRTEGLALTASVDASHFERARRVYLQVGLRGSSRYGWRRPPLDIVLVIDQPAFSRGPDFVTRFVVEVLRQLGPADRLGIVLAGAEAPTFLELARLNTAQQHLANRIDELAAPSVRGDEDLAAAMRKAGALLTAASDDEATVPGTKTLLVLSGEENAGRIVNAARAAHELTVQGCVSSVFALDVDHSEWWQVANAGYGNLHRITTDRFAPALGEEMQNLSRVVARLVRVNVRLGKDAKAIRVLGTRVLEQREVEEVKAREVATDINLSKSLGIVSDRGEDDDGIQTVIPYFYGDDSHVILIELWVEGPGTVADVTLRYKDMVNLDNATARTSVRIGARPQAPTPEQILIAKNVRGFQLAENLQQASDAIYRNDYGAAVKNLGAASSMAAETNAYDAKAVQDLRSMVDQLDWQSNPTRRATLQETLLMSGQRRVGDTQMRK